MSATIRGTLDARLIVHNAVIALVRGDAGWPAPFAERGYRLHRVELLVTTSVASVVVDVLAVRDTPASILAIEAKSGTDIADRQAKAYGAMQSADVRLQSSSVPDGPVRPIYACPEASLDDIRARLADVRLAASLLSIGSVRAVLSPAPGAEELAFDVALPPGYPPQYIPVDELSTDEELREVLLPALVALASRGRERVSVQSICEEAFPLWTQVGQGASSRMRQRAIRVLIALGREEFRGFFDVEARGRDLADGVVRVLKNPASFAPQGETQGWQAWSRRAERTMRGTARKPAEGQLTFEDLAKQEKVGESE